MRAAMIYFEDLEVGAETDFGSYEVTREEVLEFARKYDPQPFHLSDEEAAKTHFGRLAASGWHTAAMTMAVIARHVVETSRRGSARPASTSCAGRSRSIPATRSMCAGEIVDKTPSRSRPEMGSFRTETTVTNQDGDAGDDLHLDRADPPPARRRTKQPATALLNAGGSARAVGRRGWRLKPLQFWLVVTAGVVVAVRQVRPAVDPILPLAGRSTRAAGGSCRRHR